MSKAGLINLIPKIPRMNLSIAQLVSFKFVSSILHIDVPHLTVYDFCSDLIPVPGSAASTPIVVD